MPDLKPITLTAIGKADAPPKAGEWQPQERTVDRQSQGFLSPPPQDAYVPRKDRPQSPSTSPSKWDLHRECHKMPKRRSRFDPEG